MWLWAPFPAKSGKGLDMNVAPDPFLVSQLLDPILEAEAGPDRQGPPLPP